MLGLDELGGDRSVATHEPEPWSTERQSVAVKKKPITKSDIPAVARFMHSNLNPRVRPCEWSDALLVPWTVGPPNHGYFLEADGGVVGAYLAYYSQRIIEGSPENFCNLGAWCVKGPYRAQGLRLLTTLIAQTGYHFTDFSPSGNVVALNRRLKFSDLDTSVTLLPNLPTMPYRGGCRITSNHDQLLETLSGSDLAIYLDHHNAAAARHILILSGSEYCYVVFRRDRRKRIPAFASVLYVGNKQMFRRYAKELGGHLLTRYGIAATLVEDRVSGGRPRGSRAIIQSRPKMFKSATLSESQIDYLYSELTCLEW